MISDLTNKPASEIFYCIFTKKVSEIMNDVDWANFGQFVHDEMINNTCLGKFYSELKTQLKQKEMVLNMDISFGYMK